MAKAIIIRFEAKDNKSATITGAIINTLRDITGKSMEELVSKTVTIKRQKKEEGIYLNRMIIGGKITPELIKRTAETVFRFGNSTLLSMSVANVVTKKKEA